MAGMSMPNQGIWRGIVKSVGSSTISVEIPRLNPGFTYPDVPILEGVWTPGEITADTDALAGNSLTTDGGHVHTFTTNPAGAQPDHTHSATADTTVTIDATTAPGDPGSHTHTNTAVTVVHEVPAGGETDHVHTGTTASAGGHNHHGSTLFHHHAFPNPLAAGDAVLVGFLEGDADLPVCLGRLSA